MPTTLRILPVALVLVLAGCDIDDFDSSQRFTEDFHHSYALKPGGALSVETFNGSVEILGWDKDQVEINGTKYAPRQELLAALKVEVDAAADSVRIRTVRPSGERRGNMGAKFRIQVPRKTRLERVDSSNGGIRIDNIDGPARLRTSNGGLRLFRFNGDVEGYTSNGPVELTNFSGGATVETSNGPVNASGVSGRLDVTTSNSGIEASVDQLDPGRPVRLRTSNGPVRLKVASLNGNDVIAQTSNAPLTVRLPRNANVRLRAGTSNGSIDCDFDLTGRVTETKTRLEGTIGSGGPLIDLSSSNGTVRIVRD